MKILDFTFGDTTNNYLYIRFDRSFTEIKIQKLETNKSQITSCLLDYDSFSFHFSKPKAEVQVPISADVYAVILIVEIDKEILCQMCCKNTIKQSQSIDIVSSSQPTQSELMEKAMMHLFQKNVSVSKPTCEKKSNDLKEIKNGNIIAYVRKKLT